MNPIIGVTCGTSDIESNDSSVPNSYIQAIEYVGGTPIILPLVKNKCSYIDFINIMDGLLLSGGADVDPSYFDEEPIPALGRIDENRDKIEIFLAKKALEMEMPILGICRGIQTLNVSAGGTLYQDIQSQCGNVIKHRQTASGTYPTHAINIKKYSRLSKITECDNIRVNSFHHQAVNRVANNFIVSASTSDGIIECIESTNHPFAIGVQFHPERIWENNPAITAIFSALVDSAKLYKQKKN